VLYIVCDSVFQQFLDSWFESGELVILYIHINPLLYTASITLEIHFWNKFDNVAVYV
jgi:hypothetical protein